METHELIERQEQVIARLERNLALQKIKQRKADTRRKIEFGGLVIKAKMDKYPKSVIFGALIDAFENLERDSAVKNLFQNHVQYSNSRCDPRCRRPDGAEVNRARLG